MRLGSGLLRFWVQANCGVDRRALCGHQCLQGLERLLHPAVCLRLFSHPGFLIQDLLPQSSHLRVLLVVARDLGIRGFIMILPLVLLLVVFFFVSYFVLCLTLVVL